jgi:hypothetical protein
MLPLILPRLTLWRETESPASIVNLSGRNGSAKVDPTFLLGGFEIVATYELFNVNRVKLETLMHFRALLQRDRATVHTA